MAGPQATRRNSVVLIASPHAGQGANLDEIVAALRAAGVNVGAWLSVEALDAAASQGALWRKAGHSAAIAAGGDGTIGAVASHLAGSGLALGILPLGTSNDVARSLGIPLELERAIAAIAAGDALTIDAGQVFPAVTEPYGIRWRNRLTSFVTGKPAPQMGAYFLHTMTLGFNVQFAQLATDVERRERLGALNYATALLGTLTQMEPIETTIHFTDVRTPTGRRDTLDVQMRALQIAAINTPIFGGGFNLRVKDVSPRDDLLDFLLIEQFDPSLIPQMAQALLGALGNLGARLFGQPAQAPEIPGFHLFQARQASIKTPTPLDATLDGELRAQTPMTVRVAPEKLRIYLPTEARAALLEQEAHEESQPDAIPKEAERGV
jgi:YegS/Rv2252/BmrU family lipid kinase